LYLDIVFNKWRCNVSDYKYVVWVGGCDDYYTTYERAKKHYDEWINKGYDDVYIQEIT
jgi:hypothetical protein